MSSSFEKIDTERMSSSNRESSSSNLGFLSSPSSSCSEVRSNVRIPKGVVVSSREPRNGIESFGSYPYALLIEEVTHLTKEAFKVLMGWLELLENEYY